MDESIANGTGKDSQKYWAFISYSHRDRVWCDWLHKRLESYRVPRRLVGTQTREGMVPKRIYPVFRDREELPTSADLGDMLVNALQESRYLIVVCSPHSARSRWVNEEILTFKRMGRSNRILCLIVGGEPNASDKPDLELRECFPEAIRFVMGADGTLTDVRAEPIAADARKKGDGQKDALLKVIAGVLGVGFDQLKQREMARRQRRMVIVTGISLIISVITIGLAAVAYVARNEAQARALDLQNFAGQIIFEAERNTAHVAGTAELRRTLMTRALEYLDGLAEARDTVGVADERGRGYIRVARTLGDPYEPNLGETDDALAAVNKGIELLESVLDDAPDRLYHLRALAAGYVTRGDIRGMTAGVDAALLDFRKAETLSQEVLGSATHDAEDRANHSRLMSRMADALVLLGRDDEALELLKESADIKLDLLNAEAGKVPVLIGAHPPERQMVLRRDYAMGLGVRAAIVQGTDPGEAYRLLSEAYTIHDNLIARWPRHAVYRKDMARIHARFGAFYEETKDLPQALRNYTTARVLHREFYEAESGDVQALRAFLEAVRATARLELELGHTEDALLSFEMSSFLIDRLLPKHGDRLEYQLEAVRVRIQIAQVHVIRSTVQDAVLFLDDAVERCQKLSAQFSEAGGPWYELGRAHLMRGLIEMRSPDPIAAAPWLTKAIDASRAAIRRLPESDGVKVSLATGLGALTAIQEMEFEQNPTTDSRGSLERFEEQYQEALTLIDSVPPEVLEEADFPVRPLIEDGLTQVRWRLEQLDGD